MALYRYKAIASGGDVLEGQMEAASVDAVIARLSDLGHLPVKAEPMAAGRRRRTVGLWGRRMTRAELVIATRELARLVTAGVTLERALQILGSVTQTPAVAEPLGRLLERIRGGQSLADAIEAEGSPFDRVYINMVRAGELGGSLPQVLTRMSDYMARSREMQGQVTSALIYPALLLGVAILSLMLLLTLVVPQFEQLFAGANATLPTPTRIVIGVAEWTREWWWLPFLVLLVALILAPRVYRLAPIRFAWDGMLLHLPILGGAIRKVEVARFCRTLSTLVINGVPLLAALGIVRETVGNAVIARALTDVAERLKSGEGLAGPLSDARVFPEIAVHMIRVGEETGRLDMMLSDIADIFDVEVAQTLKRLLALIEPILILCLGALIGGIIVSILIAVVGINELAV
jgi:general secretion pathway protein F